MKINKYIKIIYMMTFMVSGLNGLLGTDETDRNQYMQTHIPVFVHLLKSLVSPSSVDTCGNSDVNLPEIGFMSPKLENPAENKYHLYNYDVSKNTFLGYSKEGISKIQLKSEFDDVVGVNNFGEPIPLKKGIYTREALIDNNVGRFRANVEISERTLNIGIARSGHGILETKYKPEKVFFVEIKDLKKVGNCGNQ